MTATNSQSRESLNSRIGFLLLSAGCAIGLGNVWRFPTITGQYGGAIFVLLYLFFLCVLGFPVMVMELSIGRGGQSCLSGAYRNLAQDNNKKAWGRLGSFIFIGNIVLLMFYTVITGWLLSYTYDIVCGGLGKIASSEVGPYFERFLGNWPRQILFMAEALVITVCICISGLKSGVERITKFMMFGLFLLILGLAVYCVTLSGAAEGLKFFLCPDPATLKANGFWSAVHAAMTQAFFTLSLGIGSIAIFGSYTSREKSLCSESIIIIALDTFIAICSGLVIFPCCFSFGVSPDAGPGLVFVTLPQVFLNIPHGMILGFVFFAFLSIAALTTLVAVAENIISFGIDELKMSRRGSTLLTGGLLLVLSLPCIFGFNLLSNFHPLGGGSNVLDLEDFIVSDNLLPLGSLALTIFCTRSYGWGFDKFRDEANTGNGLKLPQALRFYLTWILPIIIFTIWLIGIIRKFI